MTNLWKRSLSMFLALVMVFGMLPMSVFAADDETTPVEPTSTETGEPVVQDACAHEKTTETIVGATCTADGSKTVACECGYVVSTETIPAAHTPGAEATCTTAQICTVCEAELVAAGHKYVDGKCTVCETVDPDYAPAHEHSYKYPCATECETCTEGTREAMHSYLENGKCEFCGEAEPAPVEPTPSEPAPSEPVPSEPVILKSPAPSAEGGESTSCEHDWSNKDGICTVEDCKAECEHPTYQNGVCTTCGKAETPAEPEVTNVAQIGEQGFETLAAAIKAAQENDTIVLIDDINLTDETVTFNAEGKITIDLNGHEINGTVTKDTTTLIYVTGCELTLMDSSEAKTGGIHAENTNGKLSNLIRVETDAKLMIESGNYTQDASTNGSGMIDSRGDEIITVNGGNFRLGNIGSASNGSPWIFNASSQNTKNIIVKGGTFNADIIHQYYPFEVIVDNNLALKKNDNIWTIVDAVAYVNEQEWSGNWYTNEVGYTTLDEALLAAEPMAAATSKRTEKIAETVTLLKDALVVGQAAVKEGTSLVLGEFSVVLANADATLTAAEGLNVISGVEGYEVDYKDGVYKLVRAVRVAQIGDEKYESLQAAIDAAKDGDKIVVIDNINIADVAVSTLGNKYNTLFKVAGKTVTINLNEKTISGTYSGNSMLVGVFSTEDDGHLTLTGNGTIDITAGDTVYSLLVNYDETSTLTVENGTYTLDKASDSLVYADADEVITIKGGTFTLGNVGTGSNGSPWIFNASGQNTKNIIVKGGTFNADIIHQYYPFEVIVDNNLALKKNDNIWTIVDAVAYVNEQEWSGNWYTNEVGYTTLDEALLAAEPMAAATSKRTEKIAETVTLLKDALVVGQAAVKEGTSLVLGEFSVVLANADATLTAAEGLNVTTNIAGNKVVYEGGIYKVAPKTYVAQIGDEKYESLQDAIDAAVDNDIIELIADIDLANVAVTKLAGKYNTLFKVAGKTITIDLKGKSISGAYSGTEMLVGVFSTEQEGHLTLTGNGTVDVTATGTVYALIAAYDNGSTITIENGTYKLDKASDSLIFYGGKTDAEVTVKGGSFTLGNVGTGENGKPWIFNVVGSGDHYVYITGGTFNADVNRQFWSNEAVVAKECYMVANGNGTWTVKDGAVAYVATGMLTGPHFAPKNVGYATIEEAFAASVAHNDTSITLLKDVQLTKDVEISIAGVVLNGDGHKLDCNGNKIILTAEAATLTAAEGLNVTTNIADNKAVYEGGIYKIAPKTYVAQIGDVKYESLQEAIDAAGEGQTVKLIADIDLANAELQTLDGSYDTYFLVKGKSVTIDLNGKKISGAYTGSMLVGVFSTEEGGHLTLTGEGTVDVTATGKVYALIAAYDNGSTITIENGTYKLDKASDSLIFYGGKTDAEVTVKGGSFTLGNVGTGENGKPWIFNAVGSGDHYVYITGGTFNADVNRQFWSNEAVVAKECYMVDNGNGTWTVKDGAVAYVETGMLTGPYFAAKDVGYATIEEAFAASVAHNDTSITLLKDVQLTKDVEISIAGVVLNGDGHKLDCNGNKIILTAEAATLTAAEGLNVISGVENYKVDYTDGVYSVSAAAAKIGDTLYETVDEALNVAKSGETVVMLTDASSRYTFVPDAVTLDLHGHKYTVSYLAAFGEASVVDTSSNNVGRLIAAKNNVILPATNPMVPVYDGSAYSFSDFKYAIKQETSYTGDGVKISVLPAPIVSIAELFKDGAADNNIVIAVRLTWKDADGKGNYSQDFTFNEETIKKVYETNNGTQTGYRMKFTMTITGVESIKNLKASCVTISGTGVVDSSKTIDVTVN